MSTSTAKIQPKTVSGSLQALHTLRTRNVRASQQVVDHANFLMNDAGVNMQKKLGDDYWAFLEQLAVAALDLGNDDMADDCIGQLNDRFPDSPRVQILQGMRWEAAGRLEEALKLYNMVLEVDETNAGVWKRRVAVYKQMGETARAVSDCCAYVDAYYTDVEGWLELADLYTGRYEYGRALEALSHAMAIAPQNPFYVLQFAETAATGGRRALALKMYLRAVEMAEDVDEEAGGVARRGWYGVKLMTRKLLEKGGGDDMDSEMVPGVKMLEGLDELATERVSLSLKGGEGRKNSLKWLA